MPLIPNQAVFLLISYVGMDPTFRLGRFSVTPLVYKNLTLVKRRDGKHPYLYFMGPAFVHLNRRHTEDYKSTEDNESSPQTHSSHWHDELALSNAVSGG